MLSQRPSSVSDLITIVPTPLMTVSSPPIPLMLTLHICMLVIILASLMMYRLVSRSMTYISLSVSEMKQHGSFLRAKGGDVGDFAWESHEAVVSLSLSELSVHFLMMVYMYCCWRWESWEDFPLIMVWLVPGRTTAVVVVGSRTKGRRLYSQLRLCFDFGLFLFVKKAHLITFCVTGWQRAGGMHIHGKIVFSIFLGVLKEDW